MVDDGWEMIDNVNEKHKINEVRVPINKTKPFAVSGQASTALSLLEQEGSMKGWLRMQQEGLLSTWSDLYGVLENKQLMLFES